MIAAYTGLRRCAGSQIPQNGSWSMWSLLLTAPIATISLIMREIGMDTFNFTLGFSVMASDELDARVKLKDLLKAISKEEILWAMQLEEKDDA